MALRTILTLPHPNLRRKARPVSDFGVELQQLISDMVDIMHSAQGIGLAANQVGGLAQVIAVELPLLESDDPDADPPPPHAGELFTLVNPRISWHSRGQDTGVEGCLSLPGIAGEVERYREVRVQAQNRHGKPFSMRFEGWLARVFQHEIDHLNGVLFTDHIDDPEKVWPVTPGEEEEAEAATAGWRVPA